MPLAKQSKREHCTYIFTFSAQSAHWTNSSYHCSAPNAFDIAVTTVALTFAKHFYTFIVIITFANLCINAIFFNVS
jgi:hypothetical protein